MKRTTISITALFAAATTLRGRLSTDSMCAPRPTAAPAAPKPNDQPVRPAQSAEVCDQRPRRVVDFAGGARYPAGVGAHCGGRRVGRLVPPPPRNWPSETVKSHFSSFVPIGTKSRKRHPRAGEGTKFGSVSRLPIAPAAIEAERSPLLVRCARRATPLDRRVRWRGPLSGRSRVMPVRSTGRPVGCAPRGWPMTRVPSASRWQDD